MRDEAALNRRLALFVALIVSVTFWIASPVRDDPLFALGSVNVFANDLIVAAAFAMGGRELLRSAGARERSLARLLSRMLIAYFAYELLLVVPVALWIGKAALPTIIRSMSTRFYWILFPALLPLFRDARMRRKASMVVLAAAAGLAVWGVYLALTGSGGLGFYADQGESGRFRILGALAPPLFAWPLAVAASGVAAIGATVGLGALAVVGQTITGFRSGLIAFGAAGIAGLAASRRLSTIAAWLLPAALAGLVGYLLWSSTASAVYGYTLEHLLDFGSVNAVDRFTRWGLAWEFFRANPFNDFVWSWHRYLVNLASGYEPHNFALEIATTEGVAGLVFYGVMIAAAARTAWRHFLGDAEARAIACFLLAYVMFSAVNANWYAYSSMPLFVAGIAALAARSWQLQTPEDGDAAGAPSGLAVQGL
jgi:hypothetical protein